jgi:hypothetical protein
VILSPFSKIRPSRNKSSDVSQNKHQTRNLNNKSGAFEVFSPIALRLLSFEISSASSKTKFMYSSKPYTMTTKPAVKKISLEIAFVEAEDKHTRTQQAFHTHSSFSTKRQTPRRKQRQTLTTIWPSSFKSDPSNSHTCTRVFCAATANATDAAATTRQKTFGPRICVVVSFEIVESTGTTRCNGKNK